MDAQVSTIVTQSFSHATTSIFVYSAQELQSNYLQSSIFLNLKGVTSYRVINSY